MPSLRQPYPPSESFEARADARAEARLSTAAADIVIQCRAYE